MHRNGPMHIYSILLELTAAVVLLLFAISLLRSGIEATCREAIRKSLAGPSSRTRAAFSGCFLAILFQSSTAVAMLTAGFAASGLISIEYGLAVILGADLGSALVVKALTFDLHLLAPALLVTGGLMHLKASTARLRSIGTALLGASLLLLSLKMVSGATAPLSQSSLLPGLFAYIGNDPVTAMLIAAVFTWALHSSVAAVLLILTFVAKGVVSLEVGAPLILGANVGGAMIAVWLTKGQPQEARRLPIGNLAFRSVGAAAMLIPLQYLDMRSWLPGSGDAARLVNLHVFYNAVVMTGGLIACGQMGRLLQLVRDDKAADTIIRNQRESALDLSLVGSPSLALAAASREVLHMGELISRMLEPVTTLIQAPEKSILAEIQQLDTEVNRAHRDIKLYIATVNRGLLDEQQAKLGIELTEAAIHLEYAGDVIVKSLLPLAEERLEKGKSFSPEGWRELCDLHSSVTANVKLASSLLVSPDASIARQLVQRKEQVRKLVQASSAQHMRRLQDGVHASIESSNMHLEMTRALKEINSLVTTLAYPRLIASGDLLESRLAPAA